MKSTSTWRNRIVSALLVVVPALLFFSNLLVSARFFARGSVYDNVTNTTRRLWDFYVYYQAGRDVIENPQRLYEAQPSIVFGFVNLPIVGYLFTPFTLLNSTAASTIFWILSIFCAFAICYFLIKLTGASGWKRSVLIALVALNYPLFYSIRLGNTTHFILLLMIGLLYCYQTKRYTWAGLLLSISALIKPPLIFLLLYFIIRRSWKVILASMISLGAITMGSLVIFGIPLHLVWFDKTILAFKNKALPASNVQSIPAFILRFFTLPPYDHYPQSWLPVDLNYPLKFIIFLSVALLFGITLLNCWRSREMDSRLQVIDFSIFLTLTLLISPLSWTHYYLLLLLPFSLLITDRQAFFLESRSWLYLLLTAILLVEFPTIDRLKDEANFLRIIDSFMANLPAPIVNILLSNTVIGCLLLWLALLVVRRNLSTINLNNPKSIHKELYFPDS